MSDTTGFIFSLIAVFIVTWFLANPRVYPQSYEYAKSVCIPHKGLKFLDEDKTFYSKAICNDGVEVGYNNQLIGKDQ